jgi:nucleotide-binding universal stress UspA family protein
MRFFDPVDGHNAAEEILKVARARNCYTMVIGRQSLSWIRELVQGDLAEEVVRRGKGFTIWVVE